MTPQHFDPNIDYKRLRELAQEFLHHWTRLQALYLDAVAGFNLVRERVEQKQAFQKEVFYGTELDSEQFRDSYQFSYKQIFLDDFCTSSIHLATQGEVKLRNSLNGANFTTMGQLILVSFYDFWEDYLRKEYAKATGKSEVKRDLWGDIRHLRQSIVHNRGIAISEVDKCKLIKWFKPGDTVELTPAHMRKFFLALRCFHNELFKEQFPEHYIKVPLK